MRPMDQGRRNPTCDRQVADGRPRAVVCRGWERGDLRLQPRVSRASQSSSCTALIFSRKSWKRRHLNGACGLSKALGAVGYQGKWREAELEPVGKEKG